MRQIAAPRADALVGLSAFSSDIKGVSDEAGPNPRLAGWGIALAIVGGLLHFGYRTHSAGWMLGGTLMVLAIVLLITVLLTARNLRALNRALQDEAMMGDEPAAVAGNACEGAD